MHGVRTQSFVNSLRQE